MIVGRYVAPQYFCHTWTSRVSLAPERLLNTLDLHLPLTVSATETEGI